eukprot:2329395-Prymnesium_polylepis.1
MEDVERDITLLPSQFVAHGVRFEGGIYNKPLPDGFTYADVASAMEGATVVMLNAGFLVPKLAAVSLAMVEASRLPVWLNVYLSRPGLQQSTQLHTDKQDVRAPLPRAPRPHPSQPHPSQPHPSPPSPPKTSAPTRPHAHALSRPHGLSPLAPTRPSRPSRPRVRARTGAAGAVNGPQAMARLQADAPRRRARARPVCARQGDRPDHGAARRPADRHGDGARDHM